MIKTFKQFESIESDKIKKLESLCAVVEDKFNYLMDLKNHEADSNHDVTYHSNYRIASKIHSFQEDIPETLQFCKELIKNGSTNIGEINAYLMLLTMYNKQLSENDEY